MSQLIQKPWGQEEWHLVNSKYAIKEITMNLGFRCSLQYHEIKRETIIVKQGELLVELGETTQTLEKKILIPGELLDIPAKIIHRMSAPHSVTIYWEISTPELDDVVRLHDDFNR